MPNPLEEFLNRDKPVIISGEEVGGSFVCQECEEVSVKAVLNYEENILQWVCSKDHVSQVTMNV